MPLTGQALEDLRDALLSAFNDRDALDDLTYFGFNMALENISPPSETIPTAIKKVIRWANSEGILVDLVKEAKARRSGNVLLSQVDEDRLVPDHKPGEVIAAGTAGDFDGRLQGVVEQLASGNEIRQASAVATLQTLAASTSRAEQLALYGTTVANLRVKYPAAVTRSLVHVFEASIAALYGGAADRPDDVLVDLNRVSLPRVDLSSFDLHEADIAFADLGNADLTGCNLWRARGYGVDLSGARLSRGSLEEGRLRSAVAPTAHFHETRMIAVRLEEADLTKAEFQQALLQGAHLDGADLTGARFEGANIADADFRDATIDDDAARSLARAENWRKAKFGVPDLAAIEAHAN
jgi:uncharacterized protein YjbI with pentapeptide repeats